MDTQRSVLGAVHEIFPEAVPYIDRCSMVASFPKAGFFMSTWGIETYRKKGAPDFSQLIEEQRPVFVLANSATLRAALNGAPRKPKRALLPRDEAVLRANYIPHWGPIWVAGKRFTELPNSGFEMLIPAAYTVEATGSVVIDGKPIGPGGVMFLQAGHHEMDAPAGSFPVTLRWGEHLRMPSAAAPKETVFHGF
jgi:hypothetical protein